jgi:hypothetical protein
MSPNPSPSCTYTPGDETCFRPDCPITCMRNYKDQGDCDIPLVSQAPKAEPQPVSWWRALFGRREARTNR